MVSDGRLPPNQVESRTNCRGLGSAMRRFIDIFTPTKPLVEAFGKNYAAKRNVRNDMQLVKNIGGKLSLEDLVLNALPILKRERAQVGHWEGDTVIGANPKPAIVTLVYGKLNIVVTLKNLALPNN